jgi:hypothetical protein
LRKTASILRSTKTQSTLFGNTFTTCWAQPTELHRLGRHRAICAELPERNLLLYESSEMLWYVVYAFVRLFNAPKKKFKMHLMMEKLTRDLLALTLEWFKKYSPTTLQPF